MHLLHVNAIAVAAHLPWLIAAADGVLMSPLPDGARSPAWCSWHCWICILLGFPQFVLLNGIAVGLFAVWRVWDGASSADCCRSRDGRCLCRPQERGYSSDARRHRHVLAQPGVGWVLDDLFGSSDRRPAVPYAVCFSQPRLLRAGEAAIDEAAVYCGLLYLAMVWAIVLMPRKPPIVVWALALCASPPFWRSGCMAGCTTSWARFQASLVQGSGQFTLLLHFGMSIVAVAVFDDL